MVTVLPVKKRADFLRAQSAKNSVATAGLILQVFINEHAGSRDSVLRVGYTASTKVGNSVRRNRIKRRLRAVAKEVIYNYAKTGHDYIIIGRYKTFDREFASLVKDLKYALHSTGTYKN